jgi:hypothetical protein
MRASTLTDTEHNCEQTKRRFATPERRLKLFFRPRIKDGRPKSDLNLQISGYLHSDAAEDYNLHFFQVRVKAVCA